ncbi:MAG: acyl-CoA thioesterase domain-containing protein [Rhodospirillaceae bacterium]
MTTKIPAGNAHADFIRQRVQEALAANRAPGFHFPGYLLGLEWPHIGTDRVVETMAAGPHCIDAEGNVHVTALGVMLDTALATAPRLVIEPGARQATVHLNVQFTGQPARGDLRMETKLEGFSASDAVRQSLARGDLYADGKAVAYGTATFVVLPPPQGVKLAPLPWQEKNRTAPHALPLSELDASEREVHAACERALKPSGESGSFVERFWDVRPVTTQDGARCRVKIGPQHGNRVRHVQGGILFGLAAATARAAAPRHPMLSSVSAWFISPGQGSALKIRSKVIHAGRSFSVVNTEIRTAEGTLVLQAMSNHAAHR